MEWFNSLDSTDLKLGKLFKIAERRITETSDTIYYGLRVNTRYDRMMFGGLKKLRLPVH